MSRSTESGFIAIISVIIISAVLMAISFNLSYSGFFARSNVADGEFKQRSGGLAEACIENARIKIAADAAYAGGETVAIGSESCTIMSVTTAGTIKTIKSTASVMGTTTNLQVAVDGQSLAIISWSELATF